MQVVGLEGDPRQHWQESEVRQRKVGVCLSSDISTGPRTLSPVWKHWDLGIDLKFIQTRHNEDGIFILQLLSTVFLSFGLPCRDWEHSPVRVNRTPWTAVASAKRAWTGHTQHSPWGHMVYVNSEVFLMITLFLRVDLNHRDNEDHKSSNPTSNREEVDWSQQRSPPEAASGDKGWILRVPSCIDPRGWTYLQLI